MGLNWKAIREEYVQHASPKELDGPFDEKGNLKPKVAEDWRRASRAKPNAMTRQESGLLASKPTRTPDAVRAQCAELYRSGGLSFAKIGEITGVHPVTVRKVLIDDGVHVPAKRSNKKSS